MQSRKEKYLCLSQWQLTFQDIDPERRLVLKSNMKNIAAYRRIKERPLLSLFLGSFLTTSAIPLTIFSLFVTGSLTVGVLAFVAFQGGVILIAGMILCAFLVVPLLLSSVFALVVYGGLSVISSSSSLNVAQNPMELWNRWLILHIKFQILK